MMKTVTGPQESPVAVRGAGEMGYLCVLVVPTPGTYVVVKRFTRSSLYMYMYEYMY